MSQKRVETLSEAFFCSVMALLFFLFPFFKCSVCLSQASKIPKAKNKIQYHLGRVHQVYLEEYKTKNNNCQFMLCGWTNMIDEAVLNLHNVLKIPKEKIKYELFG